MSIIPASAKCDGCGKNRAEDSNHWHSMYICGDAISVTEGMCQNPTWTHHVCGKKCGMKLFSRWLATGKLDAE